ncbi:hypothetical protein [Cellulomonas hominis]
MLAGPGSGFSHWAITLTAPGLAASNPVSWDAPEIRCDNAVPGVSYAGCVVPDATLGLNYQATG